MDNSKLTLAHIAPYLPYGLRFYRPYLIYTGGASPEPSHEEWGPDEITLQNVQVFLDSDLPIILKPMSELTRLELESQGFSSHIDFLTHEGRNPIGGQGQYSHKDGAPYEMVLYCISKHFDVFGLIGAKLAIDINSI